MFMKKTALRQRSKEGYPYGDSRLPLRTCGDKLGGNDKIK